MPVSPRHHVTRPRAMHKNARRGATLLVIAILLPGLLAIAALAINLAYIESLNTDIQIAADAAVRAASREYVLTGDKNRALAAAQQAASRNQVGGQTLPLTMNDLEFGTSNRTSLDQPYNFQSTGTGNAVRLTTRTLASGAGVNIKPLFPMFGASFSIRSNRSAVSTQGTIDIGLVVDRSGSMAYAANEKAVYPPLPDAAPAGWDFGAPVPPQSRWLDLIAAVRTFEQSLNNSTQDELLALSVYNHAPATHVRLTNDYQQTIDALNAISVKFEKGGTNIGEGMMAGGAAVNDSARSRPFASKVLIVMSDGIHNVGHDPKHAAKILADQGITVFTVTFSQEADQTRMKEIADMCGGQHFHAVSASQLSDAFQAIARSLPTLLTR
ncbi:MAG: vWA domain-containing protein [Planctomycetota bacterium]